jgi:hypothetical protein
MVARAVEFAKATPPMNSKETLIFEEDRMLKSFRKNRSRRNATSEGQTKADSKIM